MNIDNQTFHLKQEILVRLVKAYLSDDFAEKTRLIPYDMRPQGAEVPFRCCIYKERAIIKDRLIAGLGFQIENDDEVTMLSDYAKAAEQRETIDDKNLTVLQQACKGCASNTILVTDLCQGCVARPCEKSCKFGAISVVDGKSVIDQEKCKKCQMCVKACPYHAIVKATVPCEDNCPVGAIKKDETGFASIDYDKCISCGKCIVSCPFGAVHEKSQIIDILKAMKSDKKVIALIAPSIAGQFPGTMYQLKSAIKKAGFDDVYEVAQGADVTTHNEAKEFLERMEEGEEFMTTSCCAGYNQFIKKHLSEIKPFVSDTKTPMYYTAEIVRKTEPDAVLVFVSPCVAKRAEVFENEQVDLIMNYQELGALFVAKKIEILNCDEEEYVVESSKQARNFGVIGGVAEAVKKALPNEDAVQPYVINGLNKDSIKELKKFATSGKCDCGNMIEVMCCEGGCIAGNGTVNSVKHAKKSLDKFLENGKDVDKI